MQMPAIDDTIIAVSSGWEAAPAGIVRLSGPDSFGLAECLGATPPCEPSRFPLWSEARLSLQADHRLPAAVLWFRGPASYTGQDLVELHAVGCLPALRVLTARLIGLGARRALPGEFTARAYINQKLDAWQVEGVLTLIDAENEASARRAARLRRGKYRDLLDGLTERLTELLALIEAGIDFVEEEDVRFITSAEVCQAIDAMQQAISAETRAEPRASFCGRPHVALVGLPNAGKSTLFNSLLGYERAIVSPVLGTTRDVLSAPVEVNGLTVVFQDCAGLGPDPDELELGAHLAAERTADQADLVLWVHDVTAAWDPSETAACQRVPPARRVLVRSKCDLGAAVELNSGPTVGFAATVDVSATTGTGLNRLRAVVADCFESALAAHAAPLPLQELRAVQADLGRARGSVSDGELELANPEIVALELRAALGHIGATMRGPIGEQVLERIYTQFCIGK
jgi:tRNA modification GTPase